MMAVADWCGAALADGVRRAGGELPPELWA